MKIYISGKISGIEKEAEAIFEKAENELLLLGYEVVNPMKIKHDHDLSWSSYMKEDLKAMLCCQAVYMLSNWQDSKGATVERQLAGQLGLKIIYQ